MAEESILKDLIDNIEKVEQIIKFKHEILRDDYEKAKIDYIGIKTDKGILIDQDRVEEVQMAINTAADEFINQVLNDVNKELDK